MKKLAGQGREHGYTTCSIAQDGTESSIADIQGYGITGLLIPTIDSASISFKTSYTSSGTFYTVRDSDGVEFSIFASTGAFAVATDDLTPLFGYRYLKVIASASQTSSAVDFTFVVKG